MEARFLQAGCGDGVHIRFEGLDKRFHNIIVDGGMEHGTIYDNGLKQTLFDILNNNETIDLWIITHIDDDHIGGLLRFIRDATFFQKFDLTGTQFWYNVWECDYPVTVSGSTKASLDQAIRLRDFLATKSDVVSFVTDNLQKQNIFGAEITVLSPNSDKLTGLMNKWKEGEIKLIQKRKETKKVSGNNDYDRPIESFELSFFSEDLSIENGSSIAFLLTYNGKSGLHTADSHPSTLCASLKRLGFSNTNKLKLEYLQVPHHGSKFNTDSELIELVECENYVISADGYSHNLPHKETLVRIMKHSNKPLNNFYITHGNQKTESIFEIDKKPIKAELQFPPTLTTYLSFTI